MRLKSRTLAALAAIIAAGAGSSIALADRDGPHDHGGGAQRDAEVYTLADPTHGNPEGIAVDEHSRAFFVSSVGDGAIYRGRLGDTATPVPVFIPGAANSSATGMKVFKGRLYVAGAGTGTIRVYDVAAGALLAVFDTKGADAGATFVNDLVVTRHGDVWATDSFRPALYRLSAAEIAAGTPAPRPIAAGDTITTTPEIPFTPGAFNLNGIVATHHDELVVSNTASRQLFRVKADDDAPATRGITELRVRNGAVAADGLLIDRGRLLAVEGTAAGFPNGAVDVLTLGHGRRAARIDRQFADASLRGPSTIARARGEYLVVNADFAQGRKPFTVTGLPRSGDGGDR